VRGRWRLTQQMGIEYKSMILRLDLSLVFVVMYEGGL